MMNTRAGPVCQAVTSLAGGMSSKLTRRGLLDWPKDVVEIAGGAWIGASSTTPKTGAALRSLLGERLQQISNWKENET